MDIARDKIRNIMKTTGVKATQIAKDHNISVASLRSVLYGNSVNPGYKILNALALSLHLDINDLFEDNERSPKQVEDAALFKEASLYLDIVDLVDKQAELKEIAISTSEKKLLSETVYKIIQEKAEEDSREPKLNTALIDWLLNKVKRR